LHDAWSSPSRHAGDMQGDPLEMFLSGWRGYLFRLIRGITIPGINVTTTHDKARRHQQDADCAYLSAGHSSHRPSLLWSVGAL
jgi:hypothetical protein